MAKGGPNLDSLCVNTIRMLAVDMVEQAKSGHPGMPLGAAAMAYVLWTRFLRHNPANPAWPNRDRFILSAGHGSALLYALLHLTGYDLPLEELKRFRQWGSRTPGHPEYRLTPGVEATTGPLGQGLAMAVGMAIAEGYLAGRFNAPGLPLIDHYTYVLASDGDMMEGVASEAASLAGTLGLGKLICLYDDNHISIEGETSLAFTEDVGRRFKAYGWQVLRVSDGNHSERIARAIQRARAELSRPSLIMVRTHIGFGSPKQDQAAAHGEPLGPEAAAATRKHFGWPEEPFHIPAEALASFRQALDRGQAQEAAWRDLLDKYQRRHQALAERFEREMAGLLPTGWTEALPAFRPDDGPLATRQASGQILQALAAKIDNLIGGSADLAPSNQTLIKNCPDLCRGQLSGRNIHFGVREQAMAAVVNGLALHGGIIPYGGTFLVFSDYMRPGLRLAAMMGLRSIFIFTHDSIGVGEDGPTHQPIEHLASLRAIPGLTVIRPADANETAAAWRAAIERPGPKALVLTRQKVPVLNLSRPDRLGGPEKGAYVLAGAGKEPEIILIATGSEVHLALETAAELDRRGPTARVVSMPSWEIFNEQPKDYQDLVLPPEVKARLAVEAGRSLGWERWAGSEGVIIGLDRFGASAPGPVLFERFGFNSENLVNQALGLVEAKRSGSKASG
jgi:transketolase